MTHYTFSLTLGKGKDKATALVRTLERATLYNLAAIFIEAIGFDLDHAFGFHSGLKHPHMRDQVKEFTLFADQGDAMVDHDKGVKNTLVSDVFSIKEKMLFHFDYGDDWMFIVKCEAIETTKNRKVNPEILEVTGTFPEQYPDYEEE